MCCLLLFSLLPFRERSYFHCFLTIRIFSASGVNTKDCKERNWLSGKGSQMAQRMHWGKQKKILLYLLSVAVLFCTAATSLKYKMRGKCGLSTTEFPLKFSAFSPCLLHDPSGLSEWSEPAMCIVSVWSSSLTLFG